MGQKQDPAVANHVSGQSNKPISKPPHALPFDQVIHELQTDSDEGLSPEEAAKRLEEHGHNEFGEAKGVQPLSIIGAQLANAMTLVSPIPLPRSYSSWFHRLPVFSWCSYMRQSSGICEEP